MSGTRTCTISLCAMESNQRSSKVFQEVCIMLIYCCTMTWRYTASPSTSCLYFPQNLLLKITNLISAIMPGSRQTCTASCRPSHSHRRSIVPRSSNIRPPTPTPVAAATWSGIASAVHTRLVTSGQRSGRVGGTVEGIGAWGAIWGASCGRP